MFRLESELSSTVGSVPHLLPSVPNEGSNPGLAASRPLRLTLQSLSFHLTLSLFRSSTQILDSPIA